MEKTLVVRTLAPLDVGLGTLGFLVAALLLWGGLRLRRRLSRARMHHEDDLYGTPVEVDRFSSGTSAIHGWDPRVKVVCLLLFSFCVGALGSTFWALTALVLSLATVRMARIPWGFVIRRWLLLGGFLGMFFVILPLTARPLPGDVLYRIRGLEGLLFNLRGLEVASLAFLKASAIVTMTLPLLGTNPFPSTVRALEGLRLPPQFVQMIFLCYRYLFVFRSEMQRMALAMRARGFRRRTSMETLRDIGNFVGILLVRSFERTERVHEAMLARGFDGRIRTLEAPALRSRDLWMGGIWGAAGVALLVLDRWIPWSTLERILGG
jgi:cobalt/nickel transport system permease protein